MEPPQVVVTPGPIQLRLTGVGLDRVQVVAVLGAGGRPADFVEVTDYEPTPDGRAARLDLTLGPAAAFEARYGLELLSAGGVTAGDPEDRRASFACVAP